ncbi:NAD(P)H azoreductase [Lacticaseibacillus paracasei]|nr:NAD(P)H azoreductase [Lacticaseibacillus paracasei]RND43989.1 NAD(P)H azoreductase [Lacticaseibacillus paracasei]RND62782.1 NAD(P)H azoreductase [Lacticaseibacillus paracasei]RND69154.1 NAD(P)H azoreductase [Lacticaseibacillus paracasei]RND70838.1 NAD(P)H azoreductase [Lacticaseibacillus paracasei]
MTNLLVIGATGNIGQPLIRDLQDDPDVHLFAGVHNSEHAKQALSGLKVQVRRFDFLDPATFEQALADIDKVFFVRPPQLAKPKEDMYPFLDALVARHVKQVVFVSLLGVAHNPMTPHHQIEKRIVELGLPYTFIRPSFFMQNLNTTHQADIVGHRDLFCLLGMLALVSLIPVISARLLRLSCAIRHILAKSSTLPAPKRSPTPMLLRS